MREHAGSDRILASLHEAALDYSSWPKAAGLIDKTLGKLGLTRRHELVRLVRSRSQSVDTRS